MKSKPVFPNPIIKAKIKCCQCKEMAVMFAWKLPFCKVHAPYLKVTKGFYSHKLKEGLTKNGSG